MSKQTKPREKRQFELPTLERPSIKEIDKKILWLIECQEDLDKAKAAKVNAGEALQQALIAHGFVVGGDPYVFVDGDERYIARVEPGKEKVVVKQEKTKKEKEE